MNIIFLALVVIAFGVTAFRQITFAPSAADAIAPMDALTGALLKGAGAAVEVAIGLIGVMALFLGLMKVMEAAGLMRVIARLLKPLMIRLFPDVPPEHPAMGAIIMNLSANFLGLGNAATPFGIKAMTELNRLSPAPGTATNAMVLFLGINTACVTLLPTSVIALRAEAGSRDPAGIVVTTFFATLAAAITGIASARMLQNFFPMPAASSGAPAPAAADTTTADMAAADTATADAAPRLPETQPPADKQDGAGIAGETDAQAGASPGEGGGDASVSVEELGQGYPVWVSLLAFAAMLALIPVLMLHGKSVSPWVIPALVAVTAVFGAIRRVPIYETFVAGAREGFDIAVRIIPYLVAILVAVAMFRESGAMAMLITPLGALTAPFGLPAEGLVMGILRSLSGSGAYGLLTSYLKDPAIGPDSYTGYLVSTVFGSSETTFYVLSVYFGAVQLRKIRHALWTGLLADAAGIVAAVVICRAMVG